MNAQLLSIPLAQPLVLSEFVRILQKLHGTHFGSIGFEMLGSDMRIFLMEYLPSLDGWVNFFADIPIAKVSFTHETKPARIEHLFSAARVLFRAGHQSSRCKHSLS